MIDIKLIRENPDLVKDAVRKKGMKVDIDQVLAVDARRRALETRFLLRSLCTTTGPTSASPQRLPRGRASIFKRR